MDEGADRRTLAFYDREASAYARRGCNGQGFATLDAFLTRLSPSAHILDLGCGDGRYATEMEQRGFAVTAMDGSPAMLQEAGKSVRGTFRHARFDELEDDSAFDAVWANASLLHVPRPELGDVFRRVRRALKPRGLFYASFKSGGEEGRDRFGRYYNRPDEALLNQLMAANGPWETLRIEHGEGSGYDGVQTPWISLWASKPAEPSSG